jgi:hypothetical protein
MSTKFEKFAEAARLNPEIKVSRAYDQGIATRFAKVHPKECGALKCERSEVNGDVIELDHKDGNNHNNNFNNLQWFCKEHHMEKHGNISWEVGMDYSNINLETQTAREIKDIVIANNPKKAARLKQYEADYIRSSIRTVMLKNPQSSKIESSPADFIHIVYKTGIIIVPAGQTVTIY